MVEKLYTGKVASENLPKLLASCHFSPEALVLAEQIPQYVIDDRRNPPKLLLFERFEPDKPEQMNELANYTSGRVFQEEAELRWEKQGKMLRIVYLGSEEYAPAWQEYDLLENRELDKLVPQKEPGHYYLFGERIKRGDLEKMHGRARAGDFAEVRIPHLLRYPVQPDAGSYVRLVVREYIDAATGQMALFRFQSLEPVEAV
jgi:hypothetical protein